jgi:hypothetical protein
VNRSARGFPAPFLLAAICVATALGCNHVCASPSAQVGRDEQRTKETRMNSHQPFEIELTCSGVELKATLINRSRAAIPVIQSEDLQPSQLSLTSSDGKQQPFFDERSLMKYDNTPYCHLFASLAPGQRLDLESARFKKSAGKYATAWGPYSFDNLVPGDYRAQVTWRGLFDECFDEDTQKPRKIPGAWTGEVQSNEVKLRLK